MKEGDIVISEVEIERVVELYSDSLLRLAMHHVDNLAQAQDIVQDVFLKYVKHNKSFHDPDYEKAWLFRITINLCKDYHKHWWQKKRSDFPRNASLLTNDADSILYEIRKLPRNQRNTIYLKYYEEMDTKEIAKILNAPEGTVSSWISRGKKALRKELTKGEI